MSIYTDCIDAISVLAEGTGIWTELEVQEIVVADWPEADFKEVAHQANQAIGNAYRRQQVVRFGPVTLPDGSQDYARIAAKIAYASAQHGPSEFQTPNGGFPALMWSSANKLNRPGRMPSNNRDDREPWEDQEFKVEASKMLKPNGIEKAVAELIERVAALEAEQEELFRKLRV